MNYGFSQCNRYLIYESFSTVLPTQGGTWVQTSITYNNVSLRTGTNNLSFNASSDAIRTPLIATPGVITFWFRRSNTSATHGFVVETSPNGTTWTTRDTYSGTMSTTYVQRTVDLSLLALTNVYIRIRDTRASGTNVWYLEDLGITSTNTNQNTLIPVLGNCSQTLTSTLSYNLTDDGGPVGPIAGGYSNSVNRTVTLTPSDNTKKLNMSFTQMDLETSYDYLYVYDGPTTADPLLATINGTTIPPDVVATNASGVLTVRWTSDISNVGTWGGFAATITSVSPCTTPTNGGTISANKTSTTVNDAVTFTTSGNAGVITKFEWSYNNFTTVAGTINNPPNPYTIMLNVQQTQIWFRTKSKQSNCPEGASSIVLVNLRNATPYTTGTFDGDYISNVTLFNINNNSTSEGDGYQDFTNIVAFLNTGDSYLLSVTATNTFQQGQGYAAWIDWNGDNVFQVSENVLQKPQANSTSQTITVPSNAFVGNVLMRVLSVWGQTPSNDAYFVGPYDWGEIEEYRINISNPVSLPVELTSFEGNAYVDYNIINWVTATEHNSDYFELESSTDGENWKTIRIEKAAGNSVSEIKYLYVDYTRESLTYYKLKQYDFDGQFKIYGPISVQKIKSEKKLLKLINLNGQEISSPPSSGTYIEVYDDGSMKRVYKQ